MMHIIIIIYYEQNSELDQHSTVTHDRQSRIMCHCKKI